MPFTPQKRRPFLLRLGRCPRAHSGAAADDFQSRPLPQILLPTARHDASRYRYAVPSHLRLLSQVMASTANTRFNDVLYWCACALLAGVIILGLVKPLLMLGRFIPLDPNEGWNAYFGSTAISGGQLYPPRSSLITNNYPPLSFYIVGGVGYLTGDNIFAGRVIALLSLLFVSWSIYCWLRMTGSARRIGLLGAASFLAYAVTYGRDYVGMDDPQWLAHAI